MIQQNAARALASAIESFGSDLSGSAYDRWVACLDPAPSDPVRAVLGIGLLADEALLQLSAADLQLGNQLRGRIDTFLLIHATRLHRPATEYWQASESAILLDLLKFSVPIIDWHRVGAPIEIVELERLRQRIEELRDEVVSAQISSVLKAHLLEYLDGMLADVAEPSTVTTSKFWRRSRAFVSWLGSDSSLAQEFRKEACWPAFRSFFLGLGIAAGVSLPIGDSGTDVEVVPDPIVIETCRLSRYEGQDVPPAITSGKGPLALGPGTNATPGSDD